MDRPSAGRLAGNRRIAEGRRDDPQFRLLLSGPPGDADRTDETCTGPVLPRKTIDIEKAGDAFRKAGIHLWTYLMSSCFRGFYLQVAGRLNL